MSKRNAVTTAGEAAKLHGRLNTGIEPSYPLGEEERQVFSGIIASLPLGDWDAVRIRLATQLAQLILYNESNLQRLIVEGPTVTNEKGTVVANALQSAMNQTQSTIQSMTRTLGLSASQRGVSESNKAAGMKAQNEATAAIKRAAEDDLLA